MAGRWGIPGLLLCQTGHEGGRGLYAALSPGRSAAGEAGRSFFAGCPGGGGTGAEYRDGGLALRDHWGGGADAGRHSGRIADYPKRTALLAVAHGIGHESAQPGLCGTGLVATRKYAHSGRAGGAGTAGLWLWFHVLCTVSDSLCRRALQNRPLRHWNGTHGPGHDAAGNGFGLAAGPPGLSLFLYLGGALYPAGLCPAVAAKNSGTIWSQKPGLYHKLTGTLQQLYYLCAQLSLCSIILLFNLSQRCYHDQTTRNHPAE